MLRFALRSTLAALAIAAFAAAPAHAVTRSDAANTVISNVILLHPDADQMIAFGPQATVAAGTLVQDGFDGRDAAVAPSTCWMFWLNPHPEEKFGHGTLLVFVDQVSGSIVLQANARFWPRIGGVDYYRASNVRNLANPDLIYAGPEAFTTPAAAPALGTLAAPPRAFAPDPTAGKWALIVSGSGTAANNDEKADTDTARAIFRDVLGVPNDNITMVDDATLVQLCAAIEAMPKKCPKLYVYVTAHGLPGWFASHGDSVKAAEFAHKLKELMAGEYCIVMAQCYSGSFLDAFRDSSLIGLHMTSASADTETWARSYVATKFPWLGEIFTHYWAHCLRAGARGTAAYQCARDSVAAYVARRVKVGTAPHNPMPQTSTVFKDTIPGQATSFGVPAGTQSVCINWKPGDAHACGNATVYCQVVNGADTTWKAVKEWYWNLGQTRYFNPNGPGATGRYQLVSHANNYPDCGDIRFLANAVPETPSSVATLPGHSIGWLDASGGELRQQIFHCTYFTAPGLDLSQVSVAIGDSTGTTGGSHHMSVPLQFDPSRPWLYRNSDPSQGYDGRVLLGISATGIFDRNGFPIGSLQLLVTVDQGFGPYIQSVVATNTAGGVVIPPVDLGVIRPAFTQISIATSLPSAPEGVAGGYARLDAVVLYTETPGNVSVPPAPAPSFLALGRPAPNPTSGRCTFTLALPAGGRVEVGVFDLAGRRVRSIASRDFAVGRHPLEWDGRSDSGPAGAGVYWVVARTPDGTVAQRVVRLR